MTGRWNARKLASLLLVTLAAWGVAGDLGGTPADDAGPTAEAGSVDAEPADPAGADPCLPTEEALFVRGLRLLETRKMLDGLAVLEGVVRARPGWEPALAAYAGALLRSGRHREAAEEYAGLIGRAAANALGEGDLPPDRLARDADPEHVLGLAIARHARGDYRVADRLYRAYADLVGATSSRAAVAYARLAEMFEEADVPWGDAEAERAKALAVDPQIDAKMTLPAQPDPGAIDETAPYVRAIVLAPGRPPPDNVLGSLPALIGWRRPVFQDSVSREAEWRTVPLEILVDERGRVSEVALPPDLASDTEPGASLKDAAMSWCFEPAAGESGSVAAWIVYEIEAPIVAPPDSAAAPPADAPHGAGADSTSSPRPPKRRG